VVCSAAAVAVVDFAAAAAGAGVAVAVVVAAAESSVVNEYCRRSNLNDSVESGCSIETGTLVRAS